MSLPSLRLKTHYPCCGQAATFQALRSVPAETYQRLCQRCGQKWEIRRDLKSREAGVRIDVLTWNRAGLHSTASDRWCGERARSHNRRNETDYVLVDATHPHSGFDGEDGRWITVCDRHSTTASHDTLALARYHLPAGTWCEECE
jgi:hypothetical protein